MLWILMGVTLWLYSLLGWGGWTLRLINEDWKGWKKSPGPWTKASVTAFVGMATMATLSSIVQLGFPLGSVPATLLLVIGWALLAVLPQNRKLLSWDLSLIWGLLSVVLIASISPKLQDYDTGLYYLQAVKWNQLSSIPLGIANFHERLGFQSFWFNLAGGLSFMGFKERGFYLINPLAFVLFFGILAGIAKQIWKDAQSISPEDIVFIISSLFLCRSVITNKHGFGGPDIALVLVMTVAIWWIVATTRPKVPLLMSAFTVCIKLSAAPFFALITFWAWSTQRARTFAVLSLSGVMIGVWVFRNLLLSGCLVFPAAMTCFESIPWGVEKVHALNTMGNIVEWARYRSVGVVADLSFWNWDWVIKWFEVQVKGGRFGFQVLLVLWIVGLAIRLIGQKLNRGFSEPTLWKKFHVHHLLGICLLYWWVSAPDPRFAYGVLLPWVAILWSPTLLGVLKKLNSKNLVRSWVALPLFLLVVVAIQKRFDPEPSLGFLTWPKPPGSAYSYHSSINGELVFAPVKKDQCWDAPLPCAARFSPELYTERLRPFGQLDPVPRYFWYARPQK